MFKGTDVLGPSLRNLTSQEKLHFRVVLHVLTGGVCNACEPVAPTVSSGEEQ